MLRSDREEATAATDYTREREWRNAGWCKVDAGRTWWKVPRLMSTVDSRAWVVSYGEDVSLVGVETAFWYD